MSKEDLDIDNAELLEKLDLVVDGKLKRAGALCFGNDTVIGRFMNSFKG